MHLLLRPKCLISTTKVEAHTNWAQAASPHERWLGRWNARLMQWLSVSFYMTISKYTISCHNQHQLKTVNDFHSFWVEATTRAMASNDTVSSQATSHPDFDTFYATGRASFPFRNVDLNAFWAWFHFQVLELV